MHLSFWNILAPVLFGLVATVTSAAETSGAWKFTANLNQARLNAQAARLQSGKVLLFGGQDQLRHPKLLFESELYDPTTATWTVSGSTHGVRLNSTATLLGNGKVLAAGGCADASCNTALSSAELYDPSTSSWVLTGYSILGRSYHTATLLSNGKVLVAGGCYSVCGVYTTASAELYNPTTGKWSGTGSMIISRAQHTATLLPDGEVLVAGGSSGSNIVTSAEIYSPVTGKWSMAGNMAHARRFGQAALLSSGKVLVAGGQNYDETLAASETYDPTSGQWMSTGSMSTPRLYFVAVPLPTGKVMAVGGANPSVILSSAELYDPGTGSWSTTGSMNIGRIFFTGTVLASGQVLSAAGNAGDSTAELYLP